MRTLLLFSVLLLLFSVPNALSQNQGNSVIYILDGSGSMWGELKGSTKIAIAKEVMSNLSMDHSPNDQVGLVVYGHRQKGDCNDVEYVVRNQAHNHDEFTAAVQAINPVGRTPLYNSAKLVIDHLLESSASATIIMITDGNETCGGDLCELVKEAREQGIEFVMHIVGFDMGQEDRTNLECAARATGGLYLDAEDAGQLSEALSKANELTVEEIAPSLSVGASKDGEMVDAGVAIFKAGTEEEIASLRTYTSSNHNPAIFSIPPGTYDIRCRVVGKSGIPDQWIHDVAVMGEEIVERMFDFSSGQVSIKVTNNGELSDATVNIYSKSTGKNVERGRSYESASSNPMVKELSPGSYDVIIKSVKISGLDIEKKLENIEVMAGEIQELAHDFESCVLRVKVTFQGELCDAGVNIVSVSPRKAIDGARTYANENSNPKSFLLNPGTYEVDVRGVRLEGNPREKFTITLKKGEVVERVVEW